MTQRDRLAPNCPREPRWTSIALAFSVVLASINISGCYTRVIRIPGVVDLRTDGHALEQAPPVEIESREGLEGLVSGSGLSYVDADASDGASASTRISIEERQAWALGFFSVWNASSSEEFSAALAPTSVLSDVVIEERVTWVDV